MHDTIDVARIAEATRQRVRYTKRLWLGVLAALVLSAAVVIGLQTLRSPSRAFTALYRLTTVGWQPAVELPGHLSDVQVSPAGTVWTKASRPEGLSRYDGSAWRSYGGADLGLGSGSLSGGLALAGEEVWVAARDAAFHFDGQRWTRLPGAALRGEPCAIVAGGHDVWLLDRRGNLSHFDGERWTTSSLRNALPGVRWDSAASARIPTLARTPDGTLWLAVGGLWHYDRAAWTEVRPAGRRLREPSLLGIAGDRLWLRDHHDLVWLALGSEEWGRYTPTELGLARSSYPLGVAALGERLWVATNEGLVAHDGQRWQRLPLPATDLEIADLAVAPDGGLWVIGLRFDVPAIFRSPLVPYLALVAIGVITTFLVEAWPLLWRGRRAPPGEATPPRPFAIRVRPWWERLAFSPLGIVDSVLLVLLLDHSVRFVAERIWPGAPPWPFWVLLVGVFYLLAPLVNSLYRRIRSSQPAPRPLWRELWLGAEALVLWAMAGLVVTMLFDWLAPLFDRLAPVLSDEAVFILAGLALVSFLLVLRRMLRPFLSYDRALRSANYAGAVESLQRPAALLSEAIMLQFLGTTLYWEGRLEDAEWFLRRSLAAGQHNPLFRQSVVLDRLGYVLMEQGRHEEAIQAFSAAIEAEPHRGRPYSGQGEAYLRQEIYTERALKLVRWGLQHRRRTVVSRLLGRRELGEMWANLAWAQTLLGRHAQAEEALECAFKEADRGFKPGLAALHFRAGVILFLQGQRAGAADHFTQARRIDPVGLYGDLSTRAQAEIERSWREMLAAHHGRQGAKEND